MREHDFIFKFDDIALGYSGVVKIDCRSSHPAQYNLYLNDRELRYRLLSHVPSMIADAIDLAVAVYAVDRILGNDVNTRQNLQVILPVRNPDHMNSSTVVSNLQTALSYYTGQNWSFSFVQRNSNERNSVRQQCLTVNDDFPLEVSLWSGGLDALAGFLNRAFEFPDKKWVLCGTGSNPRIHHLQKSLRNAVEEQYPGLTRLIRFRFSTRKIKTPLPNSLLMRSRGFTFVLLGAMCAYLFDQRQLHIYENGIGAINLPFRASEVGLAHSRAVHPLSLNYMNKLIVSLIGEPFEVINPFLFATKGEMCRVFHHTGDFQLIWQTITCDHIHRHSPSKAGQCGRCSSCVLRRQALAAADIIDETPYVYTDFSLVKAERVSDNDHLPVMLYQVKQLGECFSLGTWEEDWALLRKVDPSLSLDVVDRAASHIGLDKNEVIERLVMLYRNYVAEWATFGEHIHEQ